MTVKAGDKLNHKLSAAKWNALDTLLKKTPGVTGAAEANEARDGLVMVRNLTGIALSEGSIVALRDPVFLPADNLDEFRYAMVFNAVVPTDGTEDTGGDATTDYSGRFAVMLAPCAIGEMAAACCAGIVAAKVSITASGDGFADVYHNSTAKLKSGSTGSAQILWPSTTTGSYPQDTWAIVRIGNKSAAASGIEVAMFAATGGTVLTTHSSGSPFDFYATSGFGVNKWTTTGNFAWWDVTGSGSTDYIKIKESGLYIGILSFYCGISGSGTSDPQEILLNLWARPDSGTGSPFGSYMNAFGVTNYQPSGGGTYQASNVGFGMQAMELLANDWLYFRAYNDTTGGTKINVEIERVRLLLAKLPYTAST